MLSMTAGSQSMEPGLGRLRSGLAAPVPDDSGDERPRDRVSLVKDSGGDLCLLGPPDGHWQTKLLRSQARHTGRFSSHFFLRTLHRRQPVLTREILWAGCGLGEDMLRMLRAGGSLCKTMQ